MDSMKDGHISGQKLAVIYNVKKRDILHDKSSATAAVFPKISRIPSPRLPVQPSATDLRSPFFCGTAVHFSLPPRPFWPASVRFSLARFRNRVRETARGSDSAQGLSALSNAR